MSAGGSPGGASDSFPQVQRRAFLGTLVAAGTGLAVGACAPIAGSSFTTPPLGEVPPVRDDGPFDDSWLNRLTARHRQVFDIPSYQNGSGLEYTRNYFDALRDAFNLGAPDVQAVVGVHGSAAFLAFDDDLWKKYRFGERVRARDPRTGTWALRNIFWRTRDGEAMHDFSVDRLQARGATFIFCNNLMRELTVNLATKRGTTYAAMRAELVNGLLPGVTLVPAMVLALGMAQQRGCAYVYAG